MNFILLLAIKKGTSATIQNIVMDRLNTHNYMWCIKEKIWEILMRQWTAKKLESEEGKIKSMACAVLTSGSNFFYRQLFTLFCQEMLGVCENADKPKRKFVMISITVYYYFFFFSIHLVWRIHHVYYCSIVEMVSHYVSQDQAFRLTMCILYIYHLLNSICSIFFLGFTDISYFENQRNWPFNSRREEKDAEERKNAKIFT